jgi:hypothetical protein
MIIVLVGDLWSLKEPTAILAVPVLLRPRPQSVTGLVNVARTCADRPLAESDGLLFRGSGNTHERLVEAEEVDAEVLIQESEELVIDAVVAGTARVPGGFVR